MGILSDFLLSPAGMIGYGAAAEIYDEINIKAGDQQKLFQGLGTDLRVERSANTKLLNEKLSNFRTAEQDFIKNAVKWNPDYKNLSPEDLKLKFAPMADYLKGDTFVGDSSDVIKKVFQAFDMSGGFEKGDPYTTFEDFQKKTKSAISSPLEVYSGLGWNTWQNQVGTGLAFQTPEYETAGAVDSAFRITAYNYPMFFKGPLKLSDDAVLDVARLAVLNYNARNDSTKDNVVDLYEFEKLRTDRFNEIQKGPNRINMEVLPGLLNIDSTTLNRIIADDSPYLAALSGALTQIAGIVNKEGGVQSDEFKDLAEQISGLMVSHFDYTKNIKEAIIAKEYKKIEIPGDTTAAALASKLKLEAQLPDGKNNAYRLSRIHTKVAQNPELTRIAIGDGGTFGLYLNKDGGKEFQIDGRVEESFTFMLVPSGETIFDPEEGEFGAQVTAPAKWVVVSNTGIIFDMPSKADLLHAQSESTQPKFLQELAAASLTDFDKSDAGRTALRDHAREVLHAAMEGKLDLTKRFWDPNYIRLLESQGVFGKDPNTFKNISYFGLKKQE